MDYEKKYKEALEWARKVIQGKVGFVLDEVLEKFPELRESEDEKIRKELIEQVAYIVPNDDELDIEGNVLPTYQKRIDKYRAWLEKQGKQWSEEDERIYQSIMDDTIQENQLDGKQTDWLRDIKYRHFSQPQNTWKPSKEMLEALYRAVPENVMEISEDEMLLNKLYQGLKYGRVLSEN